MSEQSTLETLIEQQRQIIVEMRNSVANGMAWIDLCEATEFTGRLERIADQMAGLAPAYQEDEDQAYDIGKRDGYEKAVQDIDLLTGGDGIYRVVTGAKRHESCPDAEAMKTRIFQRIDYMRGKFRNIISHATGGHLSEEDTPDLPMNTIAVEISRHRTMIYNDAKASGRKECTPLLIEARNQLSVIGSMCIGDRPVMQHEQGVSRGLSETIDEFLTKETEGA